MRVVKHITAALCVALAAWPSPATAQLTEHVRPPAGPLQGAPDGEVIAFKGIPYAVAQRWSPPQPAPVWTAVRPARDFAAPCTQPDIRNGPRTGVGKTSEDCLYLNVWAPVSPGPHPVMVWIHGGSFRSQASSIPYYDGSRFAARGVVLVSINYRLGPLGFFAHPALGETAAVNFGLLDQIAALRWVHSNIAAFGGDPANVTIFGESAGGASVLQLVTAPAARGLFAKAAVQSGGGWWKPAERAQAAAQAVAVIEQLGVPASKQDLATLKALPALELAKAWTSGSGPIVDPETAPGAPAQTIATGLWAKVPLLIGANSDEGSLQAAYGLAPERVLARAGDRLAELRQVYASTDDAALARDYYADYTFVAPARDVARAASRDAPTFLYHFDYLPQFLRARMPGVPHGFEIPFVFDTAWKYPFSFALLRDEDRMMAETVQACWIAFATTGAPACGGAAWSAYEPARDNVFVFASTAITSQDKFHGPRQDLVEAIEKARPASGSAGP